MATAKLLTEGSLEVDILRFLRLLEDRPYFSKEMYLDMVEAGNAAINGQAVFDHSLNQSAVDFIWPGLWRLRMDTSRQGYKDIERNCDQSLSRDVSGSN